MYQNIEEDGSTVNLRNPPTQRSGLKSWEKFFYNRIFHFSLFLAFCGFIGIGLPMVWNGIWKPGVETTIESDLRYDCFPLRPEIQPNESYCHQEICVWDKFATENEIQCYYGLEKERDVRDGHQMLPRYSIENDTRPDLVFLKLEAAPPYVNNVTNEDLRNEPIVHQRLTVSIRHYTKEHLSVLIKPADEDENLWSQHYDYAYPPISENSTLNSHSLATVSLRHDINPNLFQLKIRRRSSGAPLFNMGAHSPMIFARGLVEITTQLVNDLIYGLGQSNQASFRHNFSHPHSWRMFSQYQSNITENTTALFGSHPFYLGIDDIKTGRAYGVLLLNTHPIEVITNARPSLTMRTYGGHLEFHFFLGPTPSLVMEQLQSFIHYPALPPYWALGFHLCHTRCTLPALADLVSKMTKWGIPFESECGTSLRLQGLNYDSFQAQLQSHRLKWLATVSPHILASDNSNGWENLVLKRIEQTETGVKINPYKGQIDTCITQSRTSPTEMFYPDLFNSVAAKRHQLELPTKADGFFLDQNTPLNIANGNESCLEMLYKFEWDYYKLAELNEANPCMDLLLSKESPSPTDLPKNIGTYLALHNLYGFKQSRVAYEKLSFTGKRPLVMSLSTFMGSGRWGGHVSVPINSTWEVLKFTMKQMLDFGIFGIPLSGFPVGGYQKNKEEKQSDELIRRWYQLASMQPFMLAYSGLQQEDTYIESVREMIRATVKTRYQLLPYLYNLFYRASQTGSLVAQPLFFEFSTDVETYKIENQYMLGPAVMVAPALEKDQTSMTVYFPNGRWYDYYSGHIVSNHFGGRQDVSAVEQHVNLYVRGGHILLLQEPPVDQQLTLDVIRAKNGFELTVAFDEDHQATGEFILDQGDSPLPLKRFLKISLSANSTHLNVTNHQEGQFCQSQELNTLLKTVKLFGVIDKPENGVIKAYRNGLYLGDFVFQYDDKFGVLVVPLGDKVNLCQGSSFHLEWSYHNWS